ncbi:VOC family protein [Zophobihabitans entericus]|uniref:VOC family protein n=1 Tax=Zophobihabitans entericus TaxID=1635327 RepID=A0A6G9IDK1_9GAMM|nr:VOC family protein [Zophobihabitans entericus]QIQ21660.1 VOC family protein [Zophobihabitans entericus]
MQVRRPIEWFEIVVRDFDRAVKFYEAAFNVQFNIEQMNDMSMAIFPYPEGQTGGALVAGECYKSCQSGSGSIVIYLPADSIKTTLAKIEQLGGKTVMPCMEIGGNGYIALFTDSEENTIGLWSPVP